MSVIRTGLVSALALLAAVSAPAHAQDTTFDTAAAQSLFDGFAEQFPALNATVMRDGEIIWEAVGGTNRGPEDSVSTDYNFYSIAKMITGIVPTEVSSDALLLYSNTAPGSRFGCSPTTPSPRTS